MKIRNHLFFSLLVLSIVACGGNAEQTVEEGDTTAEQAEEQLYDEVITLHDEVMPKMGELMKLKNLLEEAEVPEEMQADATQAAQSLENAHEGMMVWMSDLQELNKKNEADMAHEDFMQGLSELKTEMQAVRDSTAASIERANTLLANLESE